MWQIVNVIGTILDTNGVYGNIAEFGVHHGLFLFLLNTLRNDDEECFAIDVFDDQRLNVDCSGRGSLSVFLSHVETLMASQRRFFRIVQRDTMSFSTVEIVDLFGKKGVKFFSIDAGHTIQHACNDLYLAQEVLVPGGIVALDDYMSVHWPGVTEGFYRFMDFQNRRIEAVFIFSEQIIPDHGFGTCGRVCSNFGPRSRRPASTRFVLVAGKRWRSRGPIAYHSHENAVFLRISGSPELGAIPGSPRR